MNVILMPEKEYQIHIKGKIVLYKDLPEKDLEINYVKVFYAPLMKILVRSQMFYWGKGIKKNIEDSATQLNTETGIRLIHKCT